MGRKVCCLSIVTLLALVAAASAADDQPAPMQPVVDSKPVGDQAPAKAAQPEQPAATSAAAEVKPAATVAEAPRRARWKPMKVEYLMANIHHPPLAFDSVQEKVKHDDVKLRSLGGTVAAAAYEVVQFPAQLALCPVYLVTKPVWRRDRAEP